MYKILLAAFSILLLSNSLLAQDEQYLLDLKRPRYRTTEQPTVTTDPAPDSSSSSHTKKITQNSRLCGEFKGKVTVHYKGRMVSAEAALTVAVNEPEEKSHYDYYIIPVNGTFAEQSWKLDDSLVQRTVTVSGNTLYVTDIIEYDEGGGNSQIRTLVFSDDYSALTFLKTEFDDAPRNPATGQIIGRFEKME